MIFFWYFCLPVVFAKFLPRCPNRKNESSHASERCGPVVFFLGVPEARRMGGTECLPTIWT